MSKEYICTGCGALYTIEDLEDDENGLCYYCDCPLVSLDRGGFSNRQTIDEENVEVNKLIDNLKQYPMNVIWEDLEQTKDFKTRLKFRGYFFKALKILNKTFKLLED